MKSFGQLLRLYRQQSCDPMHDKMLTQERLGELLGHELGDAGYSGAAVSDWERSKSKINEDDRLVLVSLITVLHDCDGIQTPREADDLLRGGNYRALDGGEQGRVFPSSVELRGAEEQGSRGEEEQGRRGAGTQSPPHPVPLSSQRRKQLILLEKVKNFWVKGVLEKSVHDMTLIDLTRQQYHKAVDHPWHDVMGTAVYEGHAQPSQQKNRDLFLEVDRALLILGAPGAGKTTTLLDLARDLIALAEQDATQPIPVILNLTSWTEKRESLASWVVEELTAKYQIPRQIGRAWLEDNELLLLLDGLDEVSQKHLSACMSVINQFRETHGLAGIVVCSRIEAYVASDTRLKLGGAILLQPLTPTQIDTYLATAGSHLAALRTALQQDVVLQEMAQSPLMLSVMSLAYRGSEEDLVWVRAESTNETNDDTAVRRQHLFATYIQRMLQRHGPDVYSPEQTKAWLTWLAQKMSHHNQAVFLIEQIQPSWLFNRKWRWFYLITSRLIDGFFIGFFMWLFWVLVKQNIPQFDTQWSIQVGKLLSLSPAQIDIILLLLFNIGLGLVVGIIDLIYYERVDEQLDEASADAGQRWQRTAIIGIIVTGLATTILILYDHLIISLSFGLVAGVSFALTTHYIHGNSFRDDIRTVEALNWSWAGSVKGVFVGLILAALLELIEFQLIGTSLVMRSFLGSGLLFFLLGGLRGNRLATTSTPNQGIWLSVASAITAALLVGLPISLLCAFLWNVSFGLIAGLLSALIAGAFYGGGNVVNHFYLRGLLWRRNCIPWRYAHFLNYAAGRVFLHKVGGGYIFIHRLLQEHFATLQNDEMTSSILREPSDMVF